MKNLLNIAAGEIGVKEVIGKKSNPEIMRYASDCGIENYEDDDTSWCSLFLNWVALKAGLERSNSLQARSWLNIGVPLEVPEPGDVVVFWRGSRDSWKGHVGIFMGFALDPARVYCLGGNQGNQVSITAMRSEQILGFRRLRPVGRPNLTTQVLKRGDTGSEVVRLQDALKQLGFNCGTSDGIFGPRTEQSLKDFQSTNRALSVSGIFDEPTGKFLRKTLKNR